MPISKEIMNKIQSKKWFHNFEIYPGVFSPGRLKVDAAKAFDSLKVPQDLSGKKVIDIGALDGAYSLEFAKRGAEVLSVDIQDPDNTGFNLMRELNNANIEYSQQSVYSLSADNIGKFDLVWYWGVFYHLKEPLVGFRNIFNIMNSDAVMFFEGEILDFASVHEPSLEQYQEVFEKSRDLPITYFTSGTYADDASNWYIPNAACLKEWLITTGFVNIEMHISKENSRASGTANKDEASWLAQYEYPLY